MVSTPIRMALAAAFVCAFAAPVLARGGGGNSGSGLSPYSALNGNDRSAGVNNGNYRDPGLDPYLGAYEGRYDRRTRYDGRRMGRPAPYYGYPY